MNTYDSNNVFAAILPFKNFVPRYKAEETDGLFKAREDNIFFKTVKLRKMPLKS